MATTAYTYDTLLQQMQSTFVINKNKQSYTLGAYMRMQAAERTKGKFLPAAITHKAPVALRQMVSAVNEKLRVKQAPPPEKTITAFPFRTVFSSVAAAIVLCTLVASFASVGLFRSKDTEMPVLQTAESQVEVLEENQLALPFSTCV